MASLFGEDFLRWVLIANYGYDHLGEHREVVTSHSYSNKILTICITLELLHPVHKNSGFSIVYLNNL